MMFKIVPILALFSLVAANEEPIAPSAPDASIVATEAFVEKACGPIGCYGGCFNGTDCSLMVPPISSCQQSFCPDRCHIEAAELSLIQARDYYNLACKDAALGFSTQCGGCCENRVLNLALSYSELYSAYAFAEGALSYLKGPAFSVAEKTGAALQKTNECKGCNPLCAKFAYEEIGALLSDIERIVQTLKGHRRDCDCAQAAVCVCGLVQRIKENVITVGCTALPCAQCPTLFRDSNGIYELLGSFPSFGTCLVEFLKENECLIG